MRRRQKHPGEIGETGILFEKSSVLHAEFVGLVGLGGNLTLELADVLYKAISISHAEDRGRMDPYPFCGSGKRGQRLCCGADGAPCC